MLTSIDHGHASLLDLRNILINLTYAFQVKIMKLSQQSLLSICWFSIFWLLLLAFLNSFRALLDLLRRFLWSFGILRHDWRRSLPFGSILFVFICLNAAQSLLLYRQSRFLFLWQSLLRDLAYLTLCTLLTVHTWRPFFLLPHLQLLLFHQLNSNDPRFTNVFRAIRFSPQLWMLLWFAPAFLDLCLWLHLSLGTIGMLPFLRQVLLLWWHLVVPWIFLEMLLRKLPNWWVVVHGLAMGHLTMSKYWTFSQGGQHAVLLLKVGSIHRYCVLRDGVLWACHLGHLICWLD